jgi:glycosyltransferase involved in cell wall biosynthesis
MPEISVLMSVYNGERFLRQAIESVLTQSFSDFEFIIVNDASTDSTLEILKEYQAADQRIRLLSNTENLGLSKSLNRGLELATGEFIARMDADDVCRPERFATQLSWLKSKPEILVLGSNIQKIDENGTPLSIGSPPYSQAELRWNSFFGGNFVVCHPSVMMRHKVFDRFGGYAEIPTSQDLELWGRMMEMRPYPIANLESVLLDYRIHRSSISEERSDLQYETSNLVRQQTLHRIFSKDYPLFVIEEYRLASIEKSTADKRDLKRCIVAWFEILQQFQTLYSFTEKECKPCLEDVLYRSTKYVSRNPARLIAGRQIWLPVLLGKLDTKYLKLLWNEKVSQVVRNKNGKTAN